MEPTLGLHAAGHEGTILTVLLVAAAIGLVVYAIRERSQGAERRRARQQRAREAARAERDAQRHTEETLPRAIAHETKPSQDRS